VRDDRRLNALARGRLRAQRGACPRLAGSEESWRATARHDLVGGPGDADPDPAAPLGAAWLQPAPGKLR
jgi:hypothetical protein